MALGPAFFTGVGGAVQDLFAADALRTRATGQRIEAQEYDLARTLALQNEQFAKTSTAIKEFQTTRNIETVLGQQRADVAGSGFAASGSALDIMRDSASQGALTKAVVGQQGLIEEAGYREQADSFALMSQASRLSADASEHAATGATWSSIFKGVGAVASLI